ncbi:hypothetical protein RUM43_011997 [Polyplax serrata]|uniref:RNA helicase n=1 Tax=Polyplax serrata TaxID=468196 RepID=A0AAN8NZ23_POLSC
MDLAKCTLTSIINPGQYLMTDLDDEHCSQIKHVEELLSKESKCWTNLNVTLFPDMFVAVRVRPNDNTLKRGKLKKKVDSDLFEVYLIDYGKLITVEKCNIYISMNKNFNAIEPLTFTFKLLGLLPVELCNIDGVKRQRVCDNWSTKAEMFVKELFKTERKIEINYILIYGDAIYGDVHIMEDNGVVISLRKLLISQQLCVYSHDYYLKKVFNINESFEQQASAVKAGSSSQISMETNEKKTSTHIKETDESIKLNNSGKSNKVDTSLVQSPAVTDTLNKPLSFKSESKSIGVNGVTKKSQFHDNDCAVTTVDDLKSREVDSELDTMFYVNNPMFRSSQIYGNVFNTSEENIDPDDNDSCEIHLQKSLPECMPNKMGEYADPFVFCADTNIEPVKKFRDLEIEVDTKQSLANWGRFDDLSPIQKWTIPAILSTNDVIVIGSPKTGKTLSYVISVLDFVKKMVQTDLPDGNGPLAVIVCSGSCVAESIYYMFSTLSATFVDKAGETLKIVLAHGGGREENVWVHLTNGCHILISTPHCLLRLLETSIVTNLERLCYLILDEIDVICESPFNQNVRIILEKVLLRSKSRRCQVICCGEKWTPKVEALVKCYLKLFTLIMGSFLEAAICARVKPKICYVQKERKCEILFNEIKDLVFKKKVLIACENSTEANDVGEYLKRAGIDCVVADEYTTTDQRKAIYSQWKSYKPVVATDDIMSELNIKDADVLVNCSITKRSKTNFFFRYSTILTNCLSYDAESQVGWVANAFKSIEELKRLERSSVILLDDDSRNQLPQILNFLTRLGGDAPHEFVEICHEIHRITETAKASPICENLLILGKCRNYKNCPQRHTLVKSLDSPTGHPTGGWVSFLVVKVHNASSFSIKLLEHFDNDGKKSQISQSTDVVSKVKNYYQSEKNRKLCGQPKIGDICGIKFFSKCREIFARAEIIEYILVDKHNQPKTVNVRQIDDGDYKQLKVTELYELPEDLASYPPLVIEVKLAGIQPMDFDSTWNREANNFIREIMRRKLEEEQLWFGKIVLALRNLLFLDPVMLKRYLPSVKTNIFDLVVHEKLINSQYGVKNEDHVTTLRKLCTEADIEIPREEGKTETLVHQPQWAFMEGDFIPVEVLAVEKTTIYLRCQKFTPLLESLENDCQRHVSGKSNYSKKEDKDICKLTVGMFCLAQLNNKWCRGRIESECKDIFTVYFVDYGILSSVEKDNVRPISKTLLMRLPCQAMECGLIGISTWKDHSSDILKEINNFSRVNETLYAYSHREGSKSERTGGIKYKLNLLNSNGKSLNKYILDNDLACAMEGEEEFVKDVPIVMQKCDDVDAGTFEILNEDDLQNPQITQNNSEFLSTEVEVPKGLGSHFSLMTDSLFENESELTFLKQFASKVFPKSVDDHANYSNCGKEMQAGSVQKNSAPSPDSKGCSFLESGSVIRPKINFKRILSLHGQAQVMQKQPELKNRDGVLTPQVECALDEKFYATDLKLYGAINPEKTIIALKTFHVLLRLKKLHPSLWPRLQRDETKHHWIRFDAENLRDEETTHSDIIEIAKRNIDMGILKEGVRTPNIRPYSDSESAMDDDDLLEEDD